MVRSLPSAASLLCMLLILDVQSALPHESGKTVFWTAFASVGYARVAPNILRDYHDYLGPTRHRTILIRDYRRSALGNFTLCLDAGWKSGWNIVDQVSIESTEGNWHMYEPWNIGESGPVILLSIETTL